VRWTLGVIGVEGEPILGSRTPIANSVSVMSYVKGRKVLGGDVMCALDAAFETISSSSLQQCSLKCGRDATCTGFNIKNSTTCDLYDRKPTIVSPVSGCTFYQVETFSLYLALFIDVTWSLFIKR